MPCWPCEVALADFFLDLLLEVLPDLCDWTWTTYENWKMTWLILVDVVGWCCCRRRKQQRQAP